MPRPVKRTFREAGQTLTLLDHGTHHELLLGRVPLLSSALLGTERDFGRLARRLATGPAPRILVGGLGFGSTLAGVLEVAPRTAAVLVVEKLATIVRLLRGELAHLAPGVLADPRVTLVRADVQRVLGRERELDLVLLDVDNGPEWASFTTNARLYDAAGLGVARAALRRGGSLAVWSGYPADAFLPRLRAAGFAPASIPLRERGRVQARAYVGTK
ncbi:MAG: spermidine synthase, partial [Polyangiaceae bacterium]|nr:spermidine synthase [Polyangiaceae bacterium]